MRKRRMLVSIFHEEEAVRSSVTWWARQVINSCQDRGVQSTGLDCSGNQVHRERLREDIGGELEEEREREGEKQGAGIFWVELVRTQETREH